MAGKWYADIGGETAGPFELAGLREMAARGEVSAETRVRFNDGPWRRAGEIGGLLDEPPASGSQPTIEIDPAMNDTKEFRLLADTAKTEVVKPYPDTPLPRRSVGPAAPGAGSGRPPAVLWAMVMAVILIAIAVWALTGK